MISSLDLIHPSAVDHQQCVADVFTAATESRPYRKGTGRNETLPILQNLARSGSLDDNVVVNQPSRGTTKLFQELG